MTSRYRTASQRLAKIRRTQRREATRRTITRTILIITAGLLILTCAHTTQNTTITYTQITPTPSSTSR
jgi:hypothetical protein